MEWVNNKYSEIEIASARIAVNTYKQEHETPRQIKGYIINHQSPEGLVSPL
jgi:hypothetical protein